VRNSDGDQLVQLTSHEMPQLKALYDRARSYIRRELDEQLDEIVKELDKPKRKVDLK
jgi:hypothetical protein